MTQDEVLRDLLDRLQEAGIDYMIVGSTASNLWGMPRATQDADIVVALDSARPEAFLRIVEPDYYVTTGFARSAVTQHGMFNVIHGGTAFKIDLVVRRDDPISRATFSRRKEVQWLGRAAWFASPTDVSIAKLQWYQQGGGDGQLRDCAGIIRVQGKALALNELREHAGQAGVTDLLERLLDSASED